MIKGIDVSHHNGNPDFEKAKASGIQFVYIKATEGVSYRDPQFQPNAINAKKVGLPIGFYHFARPDHNKPEDEAKDFVDAISTFKYDLLPVLDLEVEVSMSDTELCHWAKTFVDIVKSKTGHDVMLYTGLYYLSKYPAVSELHLPLWIAAYRSQPPTVKGWDSWTMWQYSENENIPGVGSCDANYLQSLEAILINKPVHVDNQPVFKRVLKLTHPMMQGDDVKVLQKRLNVTPVDGIFGSATEQSVKEWQQTHDLYVTGVVDELCWKTMMTPPTDYDGKAEFHRNLSYQIPQLRGKDIEVLQKRLNIPVTGFFGAVTRDNLAMWQKLHDEKGNAVKEGKGLKATGGVDETTWNALFPKK